MRIISSIKNNYGKFLAKSAGALALGLVAYDAHTLGKINGDAYAKTQDAKACQKYFNNTMLLTEPSTCMSKAKDFIFNWQVQDNMRHFVNSAIGYFKGVGSMLVNEIVPLTLGIGAVASKNKKAACGFGIGLAAYGILKFFKDVCGFGHSNDLRKLF